MPRTPVSPTEVGGPCADFQRSATATQSLFTFFLPQPCCSSLYAAGRMSTWSCQTRERVLRSAHGGRRRNSAIFFFFFFPRVQFFAQRPHGELHVSASFFTYRWQRHGWSVPVTSTYFQKAPNYTAIGLLPRAWVSNMYILSTLGLVYPNPAPTISRFSVTQIRFGLNISRQSDRQCKKRRPVRSLNVLRGNDELWKIIHG